MYSVVFSQTNAVFQFHLMNYLLSTETFCLQVGMHCPVSDPEKIFLPSVLVWEWADSNSILLRTLSPESST